MDGTDFSVVLDGANSVTVTALTGAPALNAWAVTVISAQTVAAFATGLHIDIAQVNGLETRLEAIESAVAALQALVPTTPLGSPSANAPVSATIQIPPLVKVFPGRNDAAAGALAARRTPARDSQRDRDLIHRAAAAHGERRDRQCVSEQHRRAAAHPWRPRHAQCLRGRERLLGGDGRRLYPLTMRDEHFVFSHGFEVSLWNFEVNAQMFRAIARSL